MGGDGRGAMLCAGRKKVGCHEGGKKCVGLGWVEYTRLEGTYMDRYPGGGKS